MGKIIQKFVTFFIVDFIAIYYGLKYLPEIKLVAGIDKLIIFCITLALFNVLLRPILDFIFKPIIWLSLGIFSLVLNVLIIKTANNVTPVLTIPNNIALIKLTLMISIVNFLISMIIGFVSSD